MSDAPEVEPTPQASTLATQSDTKPVTPKSRGCLWGVIGMLGCLVVLVIVISLPVILGLTTANGLFSTVQSSIQNILNPPPPVAVVNPSQTIVQSVMPLGQLVSVNAQLAKADILVSVHEGVLNACGHSANHVAVSSIEAGIDLTQMTTEDVSYDEETDSYTISLPAAQLTSCRIDFIRQYDQSSTTCGVDWDEIRLLASSVALQDFREDALEGDILERAEREAATTISSFITALTGKDVEITFREPTDVVIPDSCMPDTPQGWRFSVEDNAWIKE